MADKKSDIFSDKKPTANETRKEQERDELRIKDKVDAAHVQHNKNAEAHKAENAKAAYARRETAEKDPTTFTQGDGHTYLRTYPSGRIPTGQWGLAVWGRGSSPEYPAFLDNQGEWWWATTTAQNGVNPAVEKTEEPVGWRSI